MSLFEITSYKNHSKNINSTSFVAHTHEYYELYCFLSGNAVFSIEGNLYPLNPGDIIIMNKAETHHIMHKSDGLYSRMCAHFWCSKDCDPKFEALLEPFSNRPLGFYNRYPAHIFKNNQQLHYLEKLHNTSDPVEKQVYLMILLQELREYFPLIQETVFPNSIDNLNRITHYINTHLSDSLHIEDICEKFYISKSQLQRNFNANLGITIGDYIMTKRLLQAQTNIRKGYKPTETYLDCGFQNYSGFFRAYKKFFGYPPSREKLQK